MKHILVISFSDLSIDPRVNRQLRLLRAHYRVTAAGYAEPGIPGIEFVSIPPVRWTLARRITTAALLKAGLFERFYWSTLPVAAVRRQLANRSFDVVLANDVNTLPLALSLKPKEGVVLDAHEYSPRELEDKWTWRLVFQPYVSYLCKRYIPRVSAMTTVCEGIAEEYERNFGVRPIVVTNAPYLASLSPTPSKEGVVRLVHHGGAIPSRKIEAMIEMMTHLDRRFSLDFYLMPTDERYLRHLRRMASGDARIRFRPPVPMADLPTLVNRYDVGVFLLEPTNFNYRYALPNKLFEFIQGRIAVAIGASPEMARVIRKYDCGIVADDFSPATLAKALSSLTPERLDHYKRRADVAAQDLCYENSSRALLRVLSAADGSEH